MFNISRQQSETRNLFEAKQFATPIELKQICGSASHLQCQLHHGKQFSVNVSDMKIFGYYGYTDYLHRGKQSHL